MYGILICYDEKTQSGVVWCEDQKDLAIINKSTLAASATNQLSAGDQFYFRESRNSGVRRVEKIEQFLQTGNSTVSQNPASHLKPPQPSNGYPPLRLVR